MTARRCVAALGLLVCIALWSRATPAATFVISPVHPTTADSVTVTMSSIDWQGCWTIGQVACSQIHPDTLATMTIVNFCNGQPDCVCADYPYTFVRICTFGPLPAGAYVVRFTELHPNPYDPTTTTIQTGSVVVSAVTPTLGRTWGALKSIYR